MIVVVIIGVLAGIAYPGYRKYMTDTRRSEATVALTQIANQQERYFTECNRYARTLVGTRACGTAENDTDTVLGLATNQSSDGSYAIAVARGNSSGPSCSGGNASYNCGYVLTATPQGRQAGDGAFRIDATGAKAWDKNNDGDYADSGENKWSK